MLNRFCSSSTSGSSATSADAGERDTHSIESSKKLPDGRVIDVRLFSFFFDTKARRFRGHFERLPLKIDMSFKDIDDMLSREPRFKNCRHLGGCIGYVMASADSDGVRYPNDKNVIEFLKVNLLLDRSNLFEAKYFPNYNSDPPVNHEGATGDAIMFSIPLEFAHVPEEAKNLMMCVLRTDPFNRSSGVEMRWEKGFELEVPHWAVIKLSSVCPLELRDLRNW
jgi:hypothetical protein